LAPIAGPRNGPQPSASEQIRSTLTDLGVRLDLHLPRAEDVLAFIERLRAYAANEDAGFHRWLESSGVGTAERLPPAW
jgi:hypothetical protein